MSGIFPIIQPETAEGSSGTLPLCREVAWDFARGVPVFSGGKPVIVTGPEAVRVWVWKALMTPRFRHEVYTWDYGCEVESLTGKAFTAAVKESEAIRYIREALLINPYIRAVQQVSVDFSGCKLFASCTVDTIYGEVSVDV